VKKGEWIGIPAGERKGVTVGREPRLGGVGAVFCAFAAEEPEHLFKSSELLRAWLLPRLDEGLTDVLDWVLNRREGRCGLGADDPVLGANGETKLTPPAKPTLVLLLERRPGVLLPEPRTRVVSWDRRRWSGGSKRLASEALVTLATDATVLK
jgi:hypothetical protein